MAREKTRSAPATNGGSSLGFEAELFKAADKLRGNMEPSDSKHVALEKDNQSLKGVLPKDYSRPALNKVMLPPSRLPAAGPELQDCDPFPFRELENGPTQMSVES